MKRSSTEVAVAGRTDHLLALCGAVAPLVLAAFVIVATLLTPGYSHRSDTVSQLGAQGRPHPEVMGAGFIVYGLLIIGLACSLYHALERGRGAGGLATLLTIYGAGVLLSGVFQDGPKEPGVPGNLEDMLHTVLAQTAFVALVLGMLTFSWLVRRDIRWRGFVQLSLAVAVLDLALGLLFMLEASRSVEGVIQRASFAISLVWVEAVSLRAYKLTAGAA